MATESVAICGEEAAGDERLVERLGWQVEEASLWRARRREAAALGRGGLARGARGEVGLRGSERTEQGEENAQTSSLHRKSNPFVVHAGFSSGELGSTAEAGVVKSSGPQKTPNSNPSVPIVSPGVAALGPRRGLQPAHRRQPSTGRSGRGSRAAVVNHAGRHQSVSRSRSRRAGVFVCWRRLARRAQF